MIVEFNKGIASWSEREMTAMRESIDIESGRGWIRWMTIVAGIASMGFVTVALVVDGVQDREQVLDGGLVSDLMFGLPLVWFVANVIRFLDVKSSALLKLLVLLPFGVGLAGFGIVQGISTVRATSAESDLYALALAIVPIVLGMCAILSVLSAISSATSWKFSLGDVSQFSLVISNPIPSMKRDPVRWVAIAGGCLFALMLFVSPSVIPVAIAMTCLVRYADTLELDDVLRRIALAVVGAGLVGMFAVVFLGSPEALLAGPGIGLLVVSSVLGMFRKRVDVSE